MFSTAYNSGLFCIDHKFHLNYTSCYAMLIDQNIQFSPWVPPINNFSSLIPTIEAKFPFGGSTSKISYPEVHF